jgi:hypothetical protein
MIFKTVWIGNPEVANAHIGACEQAGSVILEENTDNLQGYDGLVTTITPVLTAVWLKESRNPPWSDARLVCLRPNQFSAGSQIPPEPKLSGAPSWDGLQSLGLLSVLSLIWVCYVLGGPCIGL